MKSLRGSSIRVLILVLTLSAACLAGAQVLLTRLGTDLDAPAFGSGLVLNGSAVRSGDAVRLTPSRRIQAGSCWLAKRQNVRDGFSTMFQFQITEPGSAFEKSEVQDVGGDGFVFVVQNAGPNALGYPGGGLGYAGITNSLAIEFDTWDNDVSGQAEVRDPNANHVSVHAFLGEANSEIEEDTLGLTANIPDLSDGEIHSVMITYTPGLLAIYVDDFMLPALTVRVNLDAELALEDGRAWVGFTAATWDAFENHDILNWAFTGAER